MTARRSAETLADVAARLAGATNVRLATVADRGEALAPLLVIEPPDAESAGAVLAWASRDRVPLVIRGNGTKLEWGPPLRPADVILSTRGLSAVLAHRYGDLTATVQAGSPLASVNQELGVHRQWIPLDPSHAGAATIGGVVATNDSGPRRHRYGAPRDLIIGITIARADGRLAKAGGIVVKNVAGYDVSRLMTGSFGSLALIVDATFKLSPVPPASRTVAIAFERPATVGPLIAELAAGQTMPSAVELEIPPGRLLVRFETAERAAEQQASDIGGLASKHRCQCEIVFGAGESAMWESHSGRPWNARGSVIKISVLPSQVISLIEWIQQRARTMDWELVGRAGVGVMLLRVEGQHAELERLMTDLRGRFRSGEGHASLLRASTNLKTRVEAWGPIGDALPLMQTIKRQFDPAGILNPGRGPGGL